MVSTQEIFDYNLFSKEMGEGTEKGGLFSAPPPSQGKDPGNEVGTVVKPVMLLYYCIGNNNICVFQPLQRTIHSTQIIIIGSKVRPAICNVSLSAWKMDCL